MISDGGGGGYPSQLVFCNNGILNQSSDLTANLENKNVLFVSLQ